MIVSLHITHSSTGGTENLNNVVSILENTIPDYIGDLDLIEEYVIIRTCNRFEVYTSALDNNAVKNHLDMAIRKLVPSSNIAYILEDMESIRHLFTVVCGLDSLIVGEDQIQHQVRECYIKAKEEGHAGSMLSYLFDKAMIVGKRVRSETDLNKGAVSVGSAAVELAESKIGDLNGKCITILGAGDIASVIAKNLLGKNIGTVFVSNRTYNRALELSQELGGMAVSMDRMGDAIADSDLVLVATGAPHSVLHKNTIEQSMSKRPDRKLLVIDVSMPHNADEDIIEVENVELENMDSLESIAKANVERRSKEISSAEKIIRQELEKMDAERREKTANEIIRKIGLKFSDIRDKELAEARSHASSTDVDTLLDDMSRAIVNKISADLYVNLRRASREGNQTACYTLAEMFGVR